MPQYENHFEEHSGGFFLNDHFINDRSYYQQIQDAKKHFVETGEISPIVRQSIAEAWQEDRAAGVLPDTHYSIELPTPGYVEQVRAQNSLLIQVGSSVINTVCQTLSKIDFSIQLYSSAGILLYMSGPGEDQQNQWTPPPRTVIGVDSSKGPVTNAVTLALRHGQAFSVYGSEHYLNQYNNLTNCATPIFGTHRETVGLLNVCYYAETRTELLAGLSLLCANLIGRQLQNLDYSETLNTVFENMSDAAMVLDSHLRVSVLNRRFRKILSVVGDSGAIMHQNADALFSDSIFLDALRKGRQQVFPDITLQLNDRSFRLNISCYPTRSGGHRTGYILLCREVQKIVALSQQYTASTPVDFDHIVTEAPAMEQLIQYCKMLAPTDVTVLLEGESGTGKELFAQSIHSASARRKYPFIVVNCAAIPASLMESELFGYEKGSFSGALTTGKVGKFELANNGTIFLDEIGELPLDVQGKLLRVLETHRVTRIGAKDEIPLNFRVVAATNRDLHSMVERHSFRADLYYRLNVISINIPPLRQRGQDPELLSRHFLQALNDKYSTDICLSPDAVAAIRTYNWPGNVRELQNEVTRAYYICEFQQSSEIQSSDLSLRGMREIATPSVSPAPAPPAFSADSVTTLKDTEKALIIQALDASDGNVRKAANKLGVPLSTLYKRIQQYNINIYRFRGRNV